MKSTALNYADHAVNLKKAEMTKLNDLQLFAVTLMSCTVPLVTFIPTMRQKNLLTSIFTV